VNLELELELMQSHMTQKPVLRGEVGCACVAREISVERGGMGERGCARRFLGGCGCEADWGVFVFVESEALFVVVLPRRGVVQCTASLTWKVPV